MRGLGGLAGRGRVLGGGFGWMRGGTGARFGVVAGLGRGMAGAVVEIRTVVVFGGVVPGRMAVVLGRMIGVIVVAVAMVIPAGGVVRMIVAAIARGRRTSTIIVMVMVIVVRRRGRWC